MKTIIMSEVKKVQGLMMAVFIALLMALFTPAVYAQTVHKSSDFNHMRTGFPLTGAHIKLECETCHVDGLFKGTPTNCAGCHSQGRRVVAPFKPVTHMLTQAPCETCHTNTISFQGARFNHVGVQPKGCQTCHTGLTAPGKPMGHIPTTLSCDSCHRTSSWLPAGFDHTGIFEPCANCHNGSKALGKPANHITTTAACDSCHKSGFITFAGAIYDHAGVLPNTCISCHASGTNGAKTKVAGHIPTGNIQCDICHVGTGFVSFAGSTMNHPAVEAVPMNCSTCHNGSYTSQGSFLGGAKAKTANHVATTAECGTCHLGRSSFLGGLFNHTTASPPVAGICSNCHNGVNALGKTNTATHNGTTASCDTCHGTANGYTSFAGATFTHTAAVYTICGTCHLGQSAGVVTKTQAHIPTTGNACDSCHTHTFTIPGGFAGSTMNHSAAISFSCTTCHNGSYTSQGLNHGGAKAKTATHIATSASCDTCHHDSSYSTFAGAVFNHAGVTPTTCGSCHLTGLGGALMQSSRTTHIPTTSNACDACHKSGYTTFAGAIMNHAAVTIYRCDNCHNGSYLSEGTQGAKVKPANHIPTAITGTLDCNTCHTSTTLWTTERMNHNGALGKTGVLCVTCHQSGATYLGNMQKKSLTHDSGGHTDCSDSGCHKPLGSKGTSWVTWN
jgi:Cytochrome c7 and related cytochrome c